MIDKIKYRFDEQFPRSTIDLEDFRAQLRGIHQMDLAPLRPMAKIVLDEMEYSTDAAAQAEYAGTGVTITKQAVSGSLVQEGSFSLKAVTDATANRSFERAFTVNLTAFKNILVWERSSQTADTIQFYLEDSGGNQSYWNITTNASADTWQQDTLVLASPDANSGTPADLSDVVAYGFRELTASTTYYFDTIKTAMGMAVAILGTNLGSYYRHVSFQRQPLQVASKASGNISAPISNPRIDILTIDSSGALAWVQGTEAASPSAPWSSVPNNVIPICEVYCKTTMTKVLEYDDRASDTNQGYILADVRPFVNLPAIKGAGANVASASTVTLGNDGTLFTITGTTTITSITAKPAGTFLTLLFSGALKVTNGSNLKLDGDYNTVASYSVLTLISDGTNWWEVGRKQASGAGANVASASTVTLGNDGTLFTITGTTTITSITAKQAGTVVVLLFSGALTVTNGSNLKLNGNYVTVANYSVLTLISDGTNWYEISRKLMTGKGANVASASTVTLGDDGNFFDITGTTGITSITAKQAGTEVTLKFNGILTLTDGSNLKLNGNFTTAANSLIKLISDGTNWWEICRINT